MTPGIIKTMPGGVACRCGRCGHEWESLSSPMTCARCRSVYWKTASKRGGVIMDRAHGLRDAGWSIEYFGRVAFAMAGIESAEMRERLAGYYASKRKLSVADDTIRAINPDGPVETHSDILGPFKTLGHAVETVELEQKVASSNGS